MSRAILASVSLLMTSAVPVAPAFAAGSALQSTVGSRTCEETPARSVRRSVIGGLAGGLIGRAVGSNRVTSTVGSWIPAQTMLTDALLNLLDCDEQQKAAKATEDATIQAEAAGGAGAKVAWRSESRPGVSGTSTVSAVDGPAAGGRRCMTVTDVVIIDGEETTMPKRMCRQPPSTRYARV
jgi:hypothetical protein